jgi:hypothetical protein
MKRKHTFARLRLKWQNIIEMGPRELECVNID